MEALTDVLSALIPPAVVAGAFIFGLVKFLRSDAAGRRPKGQEPAEKQN
jgi:hypothetical protein